MSKKYDPLRPGAMVEDSVMSAYTPPTEAQRKASLTVAWYLRDSPEDIKFVLDLLGLAKDRQG